MHDKSYEELEEEMGPAEKPPKEATLLSLEVVARQDGIFIKQKEVPIHVIQEMSPYYTGLTLEFYDIALKLIRADYSYLLSLVENGDEKS